MQIYGQLFLQNAYFYRRANEGIPASLFLLIR